MVLSPYQLPTDTWVKATWKDFADAMDDPQYDEGRGYFNLAAGRSGEIAVSEVLPGLQMALVNEALGRSQTEDDSTLLRWLMETLA